MFRTKLKGEINKDTKRSACMLPISVGQKYHENDKFIATIELINSQFGECTVVVADTLARHTSLKESENDTDDTIRQRLRIKGDEWIKRNAKALKKLTIPHKIVRWDEYLEHQKYQNKRKRIESLYTDDQPFKKAVEGAMAGFLRRYKQQHINKKKIFGEEKAFEDSLEYVKEECAVLILWPETENCDYLIYPNKLHEAMYNLRRRFIAQDNGNSTKLQPLVVEFKRVKQSLELNGLAENGQQNGHAYVSQYMSGIHHPPNPALFFQAKPPVGLAMPREQLYEFIRQHINMALDCAQKTSNQSVGDEFLRITFAYLNTLIYPITPIDNSDTSNDSNHTEHNTSNGLTP
jgi:tRNA-dependent cyclodipeptide synthase